MSFSKIHGVWNDLQGNVDTGQGLTTLTLEDYRSSNFQMRFFRHDQNDELFFIFQTSHEWEPDTDVKFHLHVVPMSNPAASEDVYFEGEYAWSRKDQELVDGASWTTWNKTYTVGTTAAFKQDIVSCFTATPPAGAKESAILLVRVQRSGTSGSDTYTTNKTGGTPQANLAILSADVHYQKHKHGTTSEIPA